MSSPTQQIYQPFTHLVNISNLSPLQTPMEMAHSLKTHHSGGGVVVETMYTILLQKGIANSDLYKI